MKRRSVILARLMRRRALLEARRSQSRVHHNARAPLEAIYRRRRESHSPSTDVAIMAAIAVASRVIRRTPGQ